MKRRVFGFKGGELTDGNNMQHGGICGGVWCYGESGKREM